MSEVIVIYNQEGNVSAAFFGKNLNIPNGKLVAADDPDYLQFLEKAEAENALRNKSFLEKKLRDTRNNLLKESDWTDLPNSPVKNKEAWLAYRQALRDLPQNFEDPSEVIWPEKPE
jgi:hypothetical protein